MKRFKPINEMADFLLEELDFHVNQNVRAKFNINKIWSSIKNASHGPRVKVYPKDTKNSNTENVPFGFNGKPISGKAKNGKTWESISTELWNAKELSLIRNWITEGYRPQIFLDQWNGLLTDLETEEAILKHHLSYNINTIKSMNIDKKEKENRLKLQLDGKIRKRERTLKKLMRNKRRGA